MYRFFRRELGRDENGVTQILRAGFLWNGCYLESFEQMSLTNADGECFARATGIAKAIASRWSFGRGFINEVPIMK
jgi:hypothetical protein